MKDLKLNNERLQKSKHSWFHCGTGSSGGSAPGALKAYGLKKSAWSNEEEMFALVHEMRTRIMTKPEVYRRAHSCRDLVREYDMNISRSDICKSE
jgi:fructose-bisphosphate aldolase class 1